VQKLKKVLQSCPLDFWVILPEIGGFAPIRVLAKAERRPAEVGTADFPEYAVIARSAATWQSLFGMRIATFPKGEGSKQ
jgi:hypothetical protein